MMKGLIFRQQQQQLLDENMSNLTSQSGTELARVSLGNIRAETNYQTQAQAQPPAKKKRNLPGNPDPDAEVIALSPKSLMATNRFVCEICNKGFQRDQNLQLHRRGHNLPWKLKQRTNKEVIRKKVYLCPEPNCVHHDPSRALGDLTGIKKHFCRKHGEKKWKCDKCSKRYAVQSDWKAHSKICGTREYRCDCGTLFSRRDSFITHRAFCDALAEESGRTNPILISSSTHLHHQQPGAGTGASSHVNLQMIPQFNPQETFHPFSLKKEQQSFSLPGQEMSPLWLASQQQPIVGAAGPGPPAPSRTFDHLSSSSSVYLTHQDLSLNNDHPNSNPSCLGPTLNRPSPSYQQAAMASPHMSATALLQKATKMGGTMSIAKTSNAPATTSSSSSHASALIHGLAPFGHKAADSSGGGSGVLIQEMMMNNYGAAAASFDDEALTFCGMLNSKKDHHHHHHRHDQSSSNGGGEGLTRDFLGLRALSQTDILNIINASSREQQQQQNHSQNPW